MILGVATQGTLAGPSKLDTPEQRAVYRDEELRLRWLLADHDADFLPYERRPGRTSLLWRARAFWDLLSMLRSRRPGLFVIEGSGIPAGIAAQLARTLWGIPYVISSGDAFGAYLSKILPLPKFLRPVARWVFEGYEARLYRKSAGFIGWTPYLAGRALTWGAPRAMTAAGWSPFLLTESEARRARSEVRASLGISESDLVAGICGALLYNRSVDYCYGMELVRAARWIQPRVDHRKVHLLIIGDGSGLSRLQTLAEEIRRDPRLSHVQIHFTGRIAKVQVPRYLAAMDLGSLPQSTDAVGAHRYTTKLSEYLAAQLPVLTGEIPLTYDLPGEWCLRIGGDSPWDDQYARELGDLLTRIEHSQLEKLRAETSKTSWIFNADFQRARARDFFTAVLRREGSSS